MYKSVLIFFRPAELKLYSMYRTIVQDVNLEKQINKKGIFNFHFILFKAEVLQDD